MLFTICAPIGNEEKDVEDMIDATIYTSHRISFQFRLGWSVA